MNTDYHASSREKCEPKDLEKQLNMKEFLINNILRLLEKFMSCDGF
jgi:hypothetical protein